MERQDLLTVAARFTPQRRHDLFQKRDISLQWKFLTAIRIHDFLRRFFDFLCGKILSLNPAAGKCQRFPDEKDILIFFPWVHISHLFEGAHPFLLAFNSQLFAEDFE